MATSLCLYNKSGGLSQLTHLTDHSLVRWRIPRCVMKNTHQCSILSLSLSCRKFPRCGTLPVLNFLLCSLTIVRIIFVASYILIRWTPVMIHVSHWDFFLPLSQFFFTHCVGFLRSQSSFLGNCTVNNGFSLWWCQSNISYPLKHHIRLN